MSGAVRKTISLPRELAREVEDLARSEGKSVSAVLQDALRASRSARLRGELQAIQGYWRKKARDKGILSEKELRKYLDR